MLVETHGTRLDSDSLEAPQLWLRDLRQQSTMDARQELLKFVGVGRKVADCVLLMSLDKVRILFFLGSPTVNFHRKRSCLWIPMFTKLLSSTTE
jgi:hypothetical protein